MQRPLTDKQLDRVLNCRPKQVDREFYVITFPSDVQKKLDYVHRNTAFVTHLPGKIGYELTKLKYLIFCHEELKIPVDANKLVIHTTDFDGFNVEVTPANISVRGFYDSARVHIKYEHGYESVVSLNNESYRSWYWRGSSAAQEMRMPSYSGYCVIGSKKINGIVLNGEAYQYMDQTNFYCQCTKCGMKDIMSVEEMRKHICVK